MYKFIRPVLFRLDAERSHNLTLSLLDLAYRSYLGRVLLPTRRRTESFQCMGLNFPNRVGLAAGLDKNADHIDALGSFGFGFIEVGTVTPRAQTGNSKPRLFRLPDEHAIINRMGFNNKGVDYLIDRVKRRRYQGLLGINIGKNADTAIENANEDYLICLHKVYPHADYITVNISSPNTPGLRDLQHGAMLKELFAALGDAQRQLTGKHKRRVPIAIKIAPDLSDDDVDSFAEEALSADIDAVIATNTTFSRVGVEQSVHSEETGGLSGRPLRALATDTVTRLGTRLAGRIPIIAAGGIDSSESAQEKIAAGAQLIQVYSGLIYHGPSLVNTLVDACHNQDDDS